VADWNPEVNNLFLDALDISEPTERSRFLDQKCQGNVKLRGHVEQLLAASEVAGHFLEAPPTDVFETIEQIAAHEALPTGTGSCIGSYRLLESIGEGGFGTVYLAEQSEPVQRRVALKIIKPGMDTRQVITRFEAERQALAMMDHPHISRVLDCGATEAYSPLGAGRPYFVMELVQGKPITRFCDDNQFTTRQRLALFSDVCYAVQHAHQKGVIHRDLKPANVLVTEVDGEATPKIIDFGIAKAVAGRLTNKTLFTELRQIIGTPAYMSPEQAGFSDLDIDTRSDIYSLGVLLYELLTGSTPFDADNLLNAGYEDMQRIIREVEPPKPSTRMSSLLTAGNKGLTHSGNAGREEWRDDSSRHCLDRSFAQSVASARRTDPQSLRRLLRGDLDWIVMKCLEKDRTRRYESASALAADVQRHLTGEPVVAAPPSRLYQLSKTLRRHRTSAAIAASFVVLVGAGLVATSTLWRQAAHARDAESEQRARAEAINTFLNDMLTAAAPAKAKGENLTVRDSLDTAAKRIEDGSMKDRPLVEAEIRITIALTYYALGLNAQAEAQLRAAHALQARELGHEHPDTLRTRFHLARTLLRSDFAAVSNLAQSTLEAQSRVLGPDHVDTLRSMVLLGVVRARAGRFAEAESLLLSAIERREQSLGHDNVATAYFLNRLGEVYTSAGHAAKAELLHREALRIHLQAFGEEHPDTITSLHDLGQSLYNQNRPEEAEAIYRPALERSTRILGPENAETLAFKADLAFALTRQGRHAEAEPLYRETLAAQLRTLGPADHDTLVTKRLFAACLGQQQKYPEAETLLRDALDAAREKYGPKDGDTSVRLMSELTWVLAAQHKDEEAEQCARSVLAFHQPQVSRAQTGEFYDSSRVLIDLLQRRGALDEALQVERELIEFLLAAVQEPDANAETLDLAAWRLMKPANEQFRDAPRALELAQRANARSGHRSARFLRTLARAFMANDELAPAMKAWEQAIALSSNDQARAMTLNFAASEFLNAIPQTSRDPCQALEFALGANELSDYENPVYLNTLALAYHRSGDSAKATEFQGQAISLLAPNAPDRAKFEAQLSEFQAALENVVDERVQ
jgi:serine/threonine protein kinase